MKAGSAEAIDVCLSQASWRQNAAFKTSVILKQGQGSLRHKGASHWQNVSDSSWISSRHRFTLTVVEAAVVPRTAEGLLVCGSGSISCSGAAKLKLFLSGKLLAYTFTWLEDKLLGKSTERRNKEQQKAANKQTPMHS